MNINANRTLSSLTHAVMGDYDAARAETDGYVTLENNKFKQVPKPSRFRDRASIDNTRLAFLRAVVDEFARRTLTPAPGKDATLKDLMQFAKAEFSPEFNSNVLRLNDYDRTIFKVPLRKFRIQKVKEGLDSEIQKSNKSSFGRGLRTDGIRTKFMSEVIGNKIKSIRAEGTGLQGEAKLQSDIEKLKRVFSIIVGDGTEFFGEDLKMDDIEKLLKGDFDIEKDIMQKKWPDAKKNFCRWLGQAVQAVRNGKYGTSLYKELQARTSRNGLAWKLFNTFSSVASINVKEGSNLRVSSMSVANVFSKCIGYALGHEGLPELSPGEQNSAALLYLKHNPNREGGK